jgi:hypothetical protein
VNGNLTQSELCAADRLELSFMLLETTTQAVSTVGGGRTTGGSMAGGAGPIAYRGTVIAASGYDFSRKMPGNVLLVFDSAPNLSKMEIAQTSALRP